MTHKYKVAGAVNWFCGYGESFPSIPEEVITPEFTETFNEAQAYLQLAKEILRKNYQAWAEEN